MATVWHLGTEEICLIDLGVQGGNECEVSLVYTTTR